MTDAKTNTEQYLQMYRQMVRIRSFEDQANQLYLSAKMPGLTHMYSGEEAVAVGICEALKVTDKITSTHRGHGHCVAKGADFKQMFCELLGKEEGYCRGKGGSMHIADQSNGNLGANAIVGGSMGIATGSALSAKRQGSDDVTVCFFGDGATNEGAFHEAMNMAAILKAPMVFVCENNGYGEWSSAASTTSVADIVDRASSYGIAGAMVDGMDVAAVHEASIAAVARARSGAGPTLLECKTYRYYDHVGRDFGVLERDPDEIARWRARDPIKHWREVLIAHGVFDDDTADTITASIGADMERAIAKAEQAPDPHPDALYEDVYSESKV